MGVSWNKDIGEYMVICDSQEELHAFGLEASGWMGMFNAYMLTMDINCNSAI